VPDKSPAPAGSSEPGALDVGLGVTAVARRLGIAPGTLRTWARRYGIGPTGHLAGTQRRYTATDLTRLILMRRLMIEGVGAAEAAVAALEQPVVPRRGLRRPRTREAPAGNSPPPSVRRRSGGGQVVPLRDASPAARGLARAAMALDSQTCAALLSGSLARRGVLVTWQDMVVPVLSGVGDRWRATGRGVEVEHLLTECVEDALREVARHIRQPRSTPPVLLAAPDLEAHDLPLHALAAALAENSVPVRMFGAGVPLPALAEAVSRVGAAVVFLWAQGAARRLDATMLAVIPDLRPRPLLVLGGPGWRPGAPGSGSGSPTDHAVRRVEDLPAALHVVLTGLGLDGPAR
jgi:MerR family transcriptional regulator, light-induced transcriptional regulator